MRLVQRSSILALASAVALSAGACGGSSSGDDTTTVNPAGMPHTYVVDQVLLPTKSGEGAKYGLDIDGDGQVDNALGNILTALSSAAGSGSLNLQGSIDDTVLQGKIILLANLKATALDMATGAALEIFVADSTMVTPQPCTNPSMPTTATCGNHLKGTGTFKVAADSPMDAQIVGKIVGGQFTGGPGTVTLEITLSATAGTPIQLNLVGARAKIPSISDMTLGSSAAPAIIAGGVTQDDLNNKVIPAVQTTVQNQIVRDCYDTSTPPKPLGAPPGCGCKSGSTGATVISLFDKSPADCQVTLDEIKNNSLIQTLLMPDVDLLGADGKPGKDGKNDSLSVGVGVTAIKATWDVPAGH
jgi:hypothetical protein